MSKKKAASTMSLKDFHGGSIPSDLPLPSAPGVSSVSGSDRNMATNWGNNLMRTDLRPRPKSSGAGRNFDEKASFLSHPSPIGRNFDEDERKPLDGSSVPRRTISDESLQASAPVRQELKLDYTSYVRVPDGPVTISVPPSPVPQTLPWSNGQFVGNPKYPGRYSGQGVNSNPPNAWESRKEVMGISEVGGSSASSGTNSVPKVAQVSALEKVSSGMWQSKTSSHFLPHQVYSEDSSLTPGVNKGIERGDYSASNGSQPESGQGQVEKVSSRTWQSKNLGNYSPHVVYSEANKGTHGMDVNRKKGNYVASRGSQAEVGWDAEDGNQGGGRKLTNYRRDPQLVYSEEMHAGASSVGSQPLASMPPEVSERPKLNLLPRSKPLEASESDYRQSYEKVPESAHAENGRELLGSGNPPKSGVIDAKTGSQPAERPVERHRLNLKPRSQSVGQSGGNLERARNSLFGGARPRELVLKERGIDEITINDQELNHSPDWVNSPKNQLTSERSVQTAGHSQRVDNRVSNWRTGKDFDRKGQRMDQEKADVERKNWKNEKWRNNRDAKDQLPEPETWRKPVEEPKSSSPEPPGTRQGKIVSALELAQAFSRSVSYPKGQDLHSPQRGVPGRNGQPFSRLTDTPVSIIQPLQQGIE